MGTKQLKLFYKLTALICYIYQGNIVINIKSAPIKFIVLLKLFQ